MGELNFFNIEKNTIIKITKLRVQTPFGPLKHSLILKCESVTQDFFSHFSCRFKDAKTTGSKAQNAINANSVFHRFLYSAHENKQIRVEPLCFSIREDVEEEV